MDRFGVSIKGVLEIDGQILLRKNERTEYELLGGRLEKDDYTAEQRLVTEFAEESGIVIETCSHREPWLYEIGRKNIIIVPYICKALSVPEKLNDEDGGTLHWIPSNEIMSCYMPQGYKDTIYGNIPHKSYSIPAKFYFKIIPNYIERDYYIEVSVKEKGAELLRAALPHYCAPRDFIFEQLSGDKRDFKLVSEPISIDRNRDVIVLNYSADAMK